jgi:RNA binding exosome subunit
MKKKTLITYCLSRDEVDAAVICIMREKFPELSAEELFGTDVHIDENGGAWIRFEKEENK